MQVPRETSATSPFREPAGSGLPLTSFGSPPSAHSRRSTGRPDAPTTEPTSTSVWSMTAHAAGVRFGPACTGIPRSDAGAPAVVTESAGAKTCVFETAATEIASGAVPGEPTVPRPKSSRSFPAAMTGTTPAFATLRTASTRASFAGSVSGPPPEKFTTSIPSATAASKAATISGVFATLPTGVGTVKTR